MKRILVVDDDPDILEVFQLALEAEKYDVYPLLSPRYIFKTIKEFQPDLIILDIMLNGMDGRAVFKELRLNSDTEKIPVIMASARYDEKYLASQQYIPDQYLEKPFDIQELLHKVNALTEN
ncbi:response regulator transcription factor [Pedobacter sandarakinus]|uniref:response regulator transcription factor n=1 Tax=Pedobacter sandarakinus TaxID=353156 RepID=UPI0022481F98|nr:response regulator [Pedobacter sandarakinus]MCX2574396.1 response regulator [Pedobacter sandarakinus]